MLNALQTAGYTTEIAPNGQTVYNADGSVLFLAQTGDVVDRFGVEQESGRIVYDIHNGPIRLFDDDGTASVDVRGNALFQDAYGEAVPNQYEGSPLPSELGVADMTMDAAESALLGNQYTHRKSPDGLRLFDRHGRPFFSDMSDNIVDTRGQQAAAGVPAYLEDGRMCPKLDADNNLQSDDKGQVYIDAYWTAVSDPMGNWTIDEELAAVMAGNGYAPHNGPQGEALFDSAGSALFMNAETKEVLNSFGAKAVANEIVYNSQHMPVNKGDGTDWVYNNGNPVYIDAFWSDVVMATDEPIISEGRLATLVEAGFSPVRSRSGLHMYAASGSVLLVGSEGTVRDRFGIEVEPNTLAYDQYNGPIRMLEGEALTPKTSVTGEKIFSDAYGNELIGLNAQPNTLQAFDLRGLASIEEAQAIVESFGYLPMTTPAKVQVYDVRGQPLFSNPAGDSYINVVGEEYPVGHVVYTSDGTMVAQVDAEGNIQQDENGPIYLDITSNPVSNPVVVLPFVLPEALYTSMADAGYRQHSSANGIPLFDYYGNALWLRTEQTPGIAPEVSNSLGQVQKRGQVVYDAFRRPVHQVVDETEWVYTDTQLPVYVDAYWEPVEATLDPPMLMSSFMTSMTNAGYTPLKSPSGMAVYEASGSALFSALDGGVTTRKGEKLEPNTPAFDEFHGPIRMFDGTTPQSDGDGVPVYLDVFNQPWSPPALTIAEMALDTLSYEVAEQTLWDNGYLNHTSATGDRVYDRRGLPYFVGPTQELVNLMGEVAVAGAKSFYLDGTPVTTVNAEGLTIETDAYGNEAYETVLPYFNDNNTLAMMANAQYIPHTNQLGEAMYTRSGLGVFIGPSQHIVSSTGTDMKAGTVVYNEYAEPMHYYSGEQWSYTNGNPDYLDAFNNPVAVVANVAPVVRAETLQQMAANGFTPHFSVSGLAVYDANGSALFSNEGVDVTDRFSRPCVAGAMVYDVYGGGIRSLDESLLPVSNEESQPVWLDAYLQVAKERVNLTTLQLDTLTMEQAEAALLEAGFEYRYSPTQERLYDKRGYPLFIGPYDSVVDVTGRTAAHHYPAFLVDGSAVPQLTAEGVPKIIETGSVYMDAYYSDVTTPMISALYSLTEDTIARMAANQMTPHTGPSNQVLFDHHGNGLFIDSSQVVHSADGRVMPAGEIVYDPERTPTHTMNGSAWQYEGLLPVYLDAYWKPVTPVPGKVPLISNEQVQTRAAAGYAPYTNAASLYVFNYAGSLLFKDAATGEVTDRFGSVQPQNSVVFDEFGGPMRFFDENNVPTVDAEGKPIFMDAYLTGIGYTIPNPFQDLIDQFVANGYVELLNPTTGAAIINLAQEPLFSDNNGSVVTVANTVQPQYELVLDSSTAEPIPVLDPETGAQQVDTQGKPMYLDAYGNPSSGEAPAPSATPSPSLSVSPLSATEQAANEMIANGYTPFLDGDGTYIRNQEGTPLFRDAEGAVVTVNGTAVESGSPAFTSAGQQVPALDANGQPMVDSNGLPVYADVYGEPIVSEMEAAAMAMIANGYTPFLDGNGTYIMTAEGIPLFRDAQGVVVTINGETVPEGSPAFNSAGQQVPAFDANGQPMVDSNGLPVYADVYGVPILSEREAAAMAMIANGYTPFLDANGTYIMNAEGTPLFRDAQGAVVTVNGTAVESGSPAFTSAGQQVPALDANGQPMVDSNGFPVYADVYGEPIVSEFEAAAMAMIANGYTPFLDGNGTYIMTAEGAPLFRDAQGAVVTINGEAVPEGSPAFNSAGQQVPAFDANGQPMIDSNGLPVYADVYGVPILSEMEAAAMAMIANGYTPFLDGNGTYIMNAEGTPLFRDAQGAVVTINGEAVPEGSPAFNSAGQQVPAFDVNGQPMVDSNGLPVYADVYGVPILSEMEAAAMAMIANGYTPFLDGNGTYIMNAEGTPLFRDAQGAVVTINEEAVPEGSPAFNSAGRQVPAFDANGQPMVDSNGLPVYADVYGNPIVSEFEAAAMAMIANGYLPFLDGNGTYIVNAEGTPLFRDAQGAVVTINGEAVPEGSPAFNSAGLQVPAFDADGQPMVDSKGLPVFADVYGTPILSEMEAATMAMIANGYTPFLDGNGTYITNAEGTPLFRDAQGAVVTINGEAMPTGSPAFNSAGEQVPAFDAKGQPMVDSKGAPVFADVYGAPIATEVELAAIEMISNGYTPFFDGNGTYIRNAEGTPLFRDAQGVVVTITGETVPEGAPAYDSTGNPVPAFDANNQPMVDTGGLPVYADVYGVPILSELEAAAMAMVANGYTSFLDGNGEYIRNADGIPLFRDAQGGVATINGEVVPEGALAYDSAGNQVPAFDADGLPLMDSKGQPVYADVYGNPILSDTEAAAMAMVANGYTAMVDANGANLVNAEGVPLFRDAQGAVATISGEAVPEGTPAYDSTGAQVPALDTNGQPMIDSKGNPVYADAYGKPLVSEMELAAMAMVANGYTPFLDGDGTYIRNAEGIPLFRDAQGAVATVNGEAVPAGAPAYTDAGTQVPAFDANGQPMVDSEGQPVYADVYGTPIITEAPKTEMDLAADQMLANGYVAFLNTDGTYVKDADGTPLFRHPDGSVATVYGVTLPPGTPAFDSTGAPIPVLDINGQPAVDANGQLIHSDVYGQPIGTQDTTGAEQLPVTADNPASSAALTPEQIAAQMQSEGWVPVTNPLTQAQVFNQNLEPLYLFPANNSIHSVFGEVILPGVPVYDATGMPIPNLDAVGLPQVSLTGEPIYVDAWFTPIQNRRRKRRQELEASLSNTTSDEDEYVLTTPYEIRYDEAKQQVFSGESAASTNELADPQALLFEVNVNFDRTDFVRSVVVNSFIKAPYTIPTGATGPVLGRELEDETLVTRPWSVSEECIFMPNNGTCTQSLSFELVACDLTGLYVLENIPIRCQQLDETNKYPLACDADDPDEYMNVTVVIDTQELCEEDETQSTGNLEELYTLTIQEMTDNTYTQPRPPGPYQFGEYMHFVIVVDSTESGVVIENAIVYEVDRIGPTPEVQCRTDYVYVHPEWPQMFQREIQPSQIWIQTIMDTDLVCITPTMDMDGPITDTFTLNFTILADYLDSSTYGGSYDPTQDMVRRRRRTVVAPQQSFGAHQRHRRAVLPNNIESPAVGLLTTFEEFLQVKQFEIDNPLQNLILSMLDMDAAKEVSAWDTAYYKDILMNPLKSTNNVLIISAMVAIVLVICCMCCGVAALAALYYKGHRRRKKHLAALKTTDEDDAKALETGAVAACTSTINYRDSSVSLNGFGNNTSSMSMMGNSMSQTASTGGQASVANGLDSQLISAVEPEAKRKLDAVYKKSWVDKLYEVIFGETDLKMKLETMYDVETAEMELELAVQQFQSHVSSRAGSRVGSRAGSRAVSRQTSVGSPVLAPNLGLPGVGISSVGMSPQLNPLATTPLALNMPLNPALGLANRTGMSPMSPASPMTPTGGLGDPAVNRVSMRQRTTSLSSAQDDGEEHHSAFEKSKKKDTKSKGKWSGLDKAYNKIFDTVLGPDDIPTSSSDEDEPHEPNLSNQSLKMEMVPSEMRGSPALGAMDGASNRKMSTTSQLSSGAQKKEKKSKGKWTGGLDKAYNKIFDTVLGPDDIPTTSSDEDEPQEPNETRGSPALGAMGGASNRKLSTTSQLGSGAPMMGTNPFNTLPQTNPFSTPLPTQTNPFLPTGTTAVGATNPFGSTLPPTTTPFPGLTPNPYMTSTTNMSGGVNTGLTGMNTSISSLNSGTNRSSFRGGVVVQPNASGSVSSPKGTRKRSNSHKKS